MAKAGVDALSNNTSIEFGPLGVTSNIIAPGPIAQTEVSLVWFFSFFFPSIPTTILVTIIELTNRIQGMERLLPSDVFESYVRSQPLGRIGSVRDIADATVYLFADTGSYVSGQTLVGEFLFRFISCFALLLLKLTVCL